MKELTSLVVSDFENSKLDPEFKAKVSKGEIIIETGSIAKNKTGKMAASRKLRAMKKSSSRYPIKAPQLTEKHAETPKFRYTARLRLSSRWMQLNLIEQSR